MKKLSIKEIEKIFNENRDCHAVHKGRIDMAITKQKFVEVICEIIYGDVELVVATPPNSCKKSDWLYALYQRGLLNGNKIEEILISKKEYDEIVKQVKT